MIVYGVGSLRTLRVHWILHELGIPYKTEPIQSRSKQTRTSAYTAINSGGKIPCLQDEEFVISESAVKIVEQRLENPCNREWVFQNENVCFHIIRPSRGGM
jgi:Glutathione S-transferase, N-terminal domain